MSIWVIPLLLWAVGGNVDREPVGMVLTIKGTASLEHADSKVVPVHPMDLLYVDDTLKSEAGSEVVLIYLADGHREQIPAAVKASIGSSGCEPETAVKRLPSNKPAGKGFQAGLDRIKQSGRGAATVLRGDQTPPQVMPISGSTVITDRPTISWQAVAHATSYQVELLAGGNGRLIWVAETDKPTLPYPKEQPPLERQRLYHWKVQPKVSAGNTGQGETIEGHFAIASHVDAEQLVEVGVLAQSETIEDLTLAATIYGAFRIHDKALAVFEKLCRLQPSDATFQTARAKYCELAGRTEEAEEARDKAKQAELLRSN